MYIASDVASDVADIRDMLMTPHGVAGAIIDLEEVPIERAASLVAAFVTDRQKYAHAAALVPEAARRYRIDTVAAEYIRLFSRQTHVHDLQVVT